MPDTEKFVLGVLDEVYGDDWPRYRPITEHIVPRVARYIEDNELMAAYIDVTAGTLETIVVHLVGFCAEGY
jgi:hypothetical protein